jgi:hypothetical protein
VRAAEFDRHMAAECIVEPRTEFEREASERIAEEPRSRRIAVRSVMSADEEAFRKALCANAGVPYIAGIAKMTEHELSSRVRQMVNQRQLWGFCMYDVRRRCGPGWPDWVILGAGGVLFRELKGRAGWLSREQRIVGRLLKYHGLDWDVWRPAQLGDGTIARELDVLTAQRLAGMPGRRITLSANPARAAGYADERNGAENFPPNSAPRPCRRPVGHRKRCRRAGKRCRSCRSHRSPG